MTRKPSYAVFRVDDPRRGTHGWMMNRVRKGRVYTKFFADLKWGASERPVRLTDRRRSTAWRQVPAAAAHVASMRLNPSTAQRMLGRRAAAVGHAAAAEIEAGSTRNGSTPAPCSGDWICCE